MKFTKLAITAALSMTSMAAFSAMQTEMFSNKVMQDGYSIEMIDHCGVKPSKSSQDFILFDDTLNRLSGWSHAKNVQGLSLNADEYTSEVVPASTCNQVPVYQNVLVKKYANWDTQHVNGIEPQFAQDKVKLSQIDSIVLEFKVSSNKSTIPSKMDVSKLYSSFLDSGQLSELDDNKINFGITIFEAGFNDQSTASLNANVFLELDQSNYFDKWVKVVIPASSLNYFTEQNWGATEIDPADFGDTTILGLRINPETQTGKVVRHNTNDTWESNTPPEAFKEMNVAFKKVALVLK